ncbi:MAG: sodium-dependent transporter [Candidatus Omnitrophica bacterium]|nr:sodium-dependent transporter [Candidatus Omnitrophota bacterium]
MSKPQLSESHHPRPQWKSRMGFILAAIGSAVGLGNIWRFSYLCYKNGGGAFLIPYTIALLVVGIPLMILELGIGHKMRGAAPLSFAKIDRRWEWCGWWAVVCAMYGIMLYYSAVISWCLSYVFYSFNLSWGDDPNDFFFNKFLQLSSGPLQIGDIRTPIIIALALVWFLCWLIVYFGVQKGVERANKIFMPLLFALTLILVIWSVNLKGAFSGIVVYLKPNFSLLSEPQIWIDAFSQIFFTLSLAFGIMIAYASYLPRKVDIVKDAFIICVGNCMYSFIAGFAVFGTLGYMATTTNQPVADVVKESIGLAFVAYPQAISLMPAFAKIFGVLFFTSLVIAGLSSAISLVEAFSSAVLDKFNYPRNTVVTFVCVSGFVGSIIFTAKSGLYWVDIVDHFITHYGLVIIGILECVAIGWIFKAKKLREHMIAAGGTFLHGSLWDICVKYVTPIILIGLLVKDFWTEITTAYEGYPWLAILLIGRDWLVVALFAALLLSMRRWKKEVVETINSKNHH